MKLTLRTKSCLLVVPLAAVASLFLVSMTLVYRDIEYELRRATHEIAGATSAGRFSRHLELQNRMFMEELLTGGGRGTAGGKAAESFRRWKDQLNGHPEFFGNDDASTLRAIEESYNRVGLAERKLRAAGGAPNRGTDAAMIREELERLLDAVPLDRIDGYVAGKESRIQALLNELGGRIAALGIFSSRGLRDDLESLGIDISMMLKADRFGRQVTRQIRGYTEVVIRYDDGEPGRIEAARERARALLAELKELSARQDGTEKDKERELREIESLERMCRKVDAVGENIVALAKRGKREEGGRLIRRLSPLASSIHDAAEKFAAGEDREIEEGIAAIHRGAGTKKFHIALFGLIVIAAGAVSPWLLFRTFVNPVIEMKRTALRVADGHLDAKVELNTGDELGELAAAFNAMTDSLAGTTVSKEYFDNIIRSIMSSIAVVSPEGVILSVNEATCAMLGCDEGELVGKPAWTIFGREAPEGDGWIADLVRGGNAVNVERFYRARDGHDIPVIFSASTVPGSGGGLAAIVCVAQDITYRKEAENALREANESLKVWIGELERRNMEITKLNKLGDTLQTCLALEEAYSVIAESMTELFPGSSGALGVILPSRDIVDTVSRWGSRDPGEVVFGPDDCWALRCGRVHIVEPGGKALPCGHVGKPHPAKFMCVPMVGQGETIGVIHLRFDGEAGGEARGADGRVPVAGQRLAVMAAGNIALAITNLKLRGTLREQAVRDPLTGLFNRRYMEESLEREIVRAKRLSGRVAVVMGDIDHFKTFNDAHGHAAGDFVLREVGGFLKARTRGSDIACRYGGEEFTLILPDSTIDGAVRRAEEIREGVARRLALDFQGRPLGSVTVSLGIAFHPDDGTCWEDVLREADAALYRAKEKGRNRVEIAGDPDREPA